MNYVYFVLSTHMLSLYPDVISKPTMGRSLSFFGGGDVQSFLQV
jgi:hypothetical protein